MTPPPPLCFCASQPSGTGEGLERTRLPQGEAGYEPLNSNNFLPLNSILPEIGVTKRTLKKLEAIQMVREQRDHHKQAIAYHARPFVLCGLPLRQPPADQLIYTRRNGRFLLEITAHPRSGLPYGQDRLIPIWLATLASQQKNRMIHFDSPSQLFDYFRLRKDGSQYRRMRVAFQRVFAATIFFGSEDQHTKHPVVDWSRFHFADQMQLWFSGNNDPQPSCQESSDNVVVLSEAFYREVCEHPIPVEREVVAALAHAPGLLDFYVWITWKSWTVKCQPAHVPLFGLNGLCNQLGMKPYSVDRLFRHKVRQWLAQVKQLWPECPAAISVDGQFLAIRSCKTSAVNPVEKAVNS
jgi:hypothetical protein